MTIARARERERVSGDQTRALLLRLLVLLQQRLEAWVVTQGVVAWFDAESPGREHCRDRKEKL